MTTPAGGDHGPARGLVERIGGPARVRAILDVLYARLFADPWVGFFFAGRERDTIVAGQLAFLLKAFGHTDAFAGRHPSVAHDALPPIREGHFDRRLVVLREVLESEGLEPADVEAWLRVERGMRAAIQK